MLLSFSTHENVTKVGNDRTSYLLEMTNSNIYIAVINSNVLYAKVVKTVINREPRLFREEISPSGTRCEAYKCLHNRGVYTTFSTIS